MILKNINLNRGTKNIFSNLNLEFINPGLNIVKGDNGSGKSSLLMLASGVLLSDNGRIFWEMILIKMNGFRSTYLLNTVHL